MLATAFGTLAAIGMQRVGRRTRTAFELMVYGTIVTPEIVIAIASLLFFVTINVDPEVDVTDAAQVDALLGGCAVVANCTTYHFGLGLVGAAIRCKTPYVDLGGLFNTPRQLEMSPMAEEARVAIVLGCGATPGVTNLMAAKAASGMGSIERVEIAFGSLRPVAALTRPAGHHSRGVQPDDDALLL